MVGYIFKENVKNRGGVAPTSMKRVAWGKMKRGVTIWAVLRPGLVCRVRNGVRGVFEIREDVPV
jgi:hypothetical protein